MNAARASKTDLEALTLAQVEAVANALGLDCVRLTISLADAMTEARG